MRPGEFVQMEEDKEVIIKTLVNHTQLFKLHRNQNLHFQDFVSNEDLVLEPTPAVPGWLANWQRSSLIIILQATITLNNCHPGRPVTEPKIVFNEFLDETTPVPNVIDVDNVKTVDLAGFDQEDEDFPIYDTEIVVLNTFPNHSSYIMYFNFKVRDYFTLQPTF